MSRRRRAAGLALLAGIAALLAGTIVNGYGASLARSYGALRPVVIAGAELPQGKPIGPETAAGVLDQRRVPDRFVPPGALARAGDAVGLEPVADLPEGSYLVASILRPPRRPAASTPGLGAGRRPVEINVSGAGTLAMSGQSPSLVDVVVTSEPRGVGPGRTYVAAAGVPLISIGPGPDGPGPGTATSVILGLTRTQALTLIAAENFARQVTLLPRG